MSYRDLRNFSEAMRDLGFPHHISLESFRTPNWELLEVCLRWLAARVEPDAVLAGGRETLEQRVALVIHAIELFVGEIRQARALATDITGQGALLYDLLAREPENREIRDRALSRPLDMRAIETALTRAVTSVGERVAVVSEQIDSVAASESALDAKLERRRADLQRAEKRLLTVQKIKPAYQGELTSLEEQIEELWEQYELRYRCVEALKHQLSLLEKAQSEAAEEQQAAVMQLIHKYEAEDLLPGKLDHSDELDSSDDSREVTRKQSREVARPATRLRIKTAGVSGSESRAGFLAGRDSLDDIRDEDDSQSDSDFSDTELFAGGAAEGRAARWSRRPHTRTLAASLPHHDQAPDRKTGREQGDDDDEEQSLASSAESELRMNSIRAGSDNEF
ncbi:clusterin-associated protein 1 isoform X2 [Leptidea sinapis]|uniref:clusterin-associated protein 1 isoform X2 n=1 Tax=Leptidea sinapis TaxID=189913 RepID=UPI0021299F2B|nr:clusterin-associated protein 1 isoform X2 [Leptidea sinapis]